MNSQKRVEVNIQELLRQHNLEAKKSLGQNFMISNGAIKHVLDAAALTSKDIVLEVGPGLGSLTAAISERAAGVVALELDQRFIPVLRMLFAKSPNVRVVLGDILEQSPSALLGDAAARYKVVANLPYYITSAVIRHLLEADQPPQLLSLTVQYEVAERMTAAPGAMSLLAVSVQLYGTAELITRLKPGNFYPRPNVDSAVVRIIPRADGPPLSPKETVQFFRIVKAGFSQPRKQLKSPLAAGMHITKQQASAWLEQARITPSRRPQTLSVEEWLSLLSCSTEYLS